MTTRPAVWLKGTGAIFPQYTLLKSEKLPSKLTPVSLINALGLRADLFHVFFMGHSVPSDDDHGFVVLQNDFDLMQIQPGSKDLFFRLERVPLSDDDMMLLCDNIDAFEDAEADKSAFAHLLARPPQLLPAGAATAAKSSSQLFAAGLFCFASSCTFSADSHQH